MAIFHWLTGVVSRVARNLVGREFAALAIGVTLALALLPQALWAQEKITVVAAADLKFALAEILTNFHRNHPGTKVDVICGSSGKFRTQIEQGAPYDLYFSADIAYPRALADKGFAATPAIPYAIGRLVLWSATLDVRAMPLKDLTRAEVKRVALANPRHAPYGKRAEEALRSASVWDALQDKLIYGENVAQAAQFVETGNASVGLIALSLALSPALASKGSYALIAEDQHEPLLQGFIVTRHGGDKRLAHVFAKYMSTPEAAAVMLRYGFARPD